MNEDERIELCRGLGGEKSASKREEVWEHAHFASEIENEPDIRIKVRPEDRGRMKQHIAAGWARDRKMYQDEVVNLVFNLVPPPGIDAIAFNSLRNQMLEGIRSLTPR